MRQKESKIFLYLAIAHIGAVHDLGLTGAIFPRPEHVSYYLNIRPAMIHCHRLFSLLLLAYYYCTTIVDFVNSWKTSIEERRGESFAGRYTLKGTALAVETLRYRGAQS